MYGLETANAAYARFAQAVDQIVEKHPDRNIAVVAHGTVITLFAQHRAQVIDPFTFWQRLDLPSFVVLSIPTFDLVTVVRK